jgi:uncharacterized protein (TIGR02145 family)
MKVIILIFILFLNIFVAYTANEPEIKCYMNNGKPVKVFIIDDIDKISIMNISNNFEMLVFYQTNLKSRYSISVIDSMKFEINTNNQRQFNIYISDSIKYYLITEIDSIIFNKTTFDLYDTVKICNQVWMTKNLNVDHYRNGDSIPQVPDLKQWFNLKTGAWCYYNNDTVLGAIYGKLYNWYAVNDPRGLAPISYHVPSDSEWTILSSFLGGESVAGGKMKEIGTTHWYSPNVGATNSSGFTGLPGGRREINGTYYYGKAYGFWWSTSIYDTHAWYRDLDYQYPFLSRISNNKIYGFSVRCVKN